MDDPLINDPGLRHYSRYEYDSLDSNMQIRLLELHRGESQDAIVCTLRHVFLRDLPNYTARSYTWGDLILSSLIICDGGYLEVSRNLERALRNLRETSRTTILWVDAICINQGDPEERGQQVGFMRDIYQQAVEVMVWLGEESDNSNLGMDLIVELSRIPNEGVMKSKIPSDTFNTTENSFQEQSWSAIGDILGRPWFNRVWVVQEIAVCRKFNIMCGQRMVPGDVFMQFMKILANQGLIDRINMSSTTGVA